MYLGLRRSGARNHLRTVLRDSLVKRMISHRGFFWRKCNRQILQIPFTRPQNE